MIVTDTAWPYSPNEHEDRYFADLFARTRLLVVLRGLDPEEAVRRAIAAWDGGAVAVEVTIADPTHLATLQAVAREGTARGIAVGAGSVYRHAQVSAAATAGAGFVVAPSLDDGVSRACRERGLPHMPGVATASEIAHAERLGHRWLKVFPARELGSSWIRAMSGPFPWARWIATGGVTLDSAAEFLAAGCAAVGMGEPVGDWSAARSLTGAAT